MASIKSQQAEGQMTSSNDLEQEYQAAQKAYIQGNYPEAATLVDRLVEHFPTDPSSRLLRGHIYCILEQYNVAREQYQEVLNLTCDRDLVDCANSGLEAVGQYETQETLPNTSAPQEPELENTFLINAEPQSSSPLSALETDFKDPIGFDSSNDFLIEPFSSSDNSFDDLNLATDEFQTAANPFAWDSSQEEESHQGETLPFSSPTEEPFNISAQR